jgi:hypothetical protein
MCNEDAKRNDAEPRRSFNMLFVFIILSLTTSSDWRHDLCTGDQVVNRYVNYAQGFSVGIPRTLIGRRVPVSGPSAVLVLCFRATVRASSGSTVNQILLSGQVLQSQRLKPQGSSKIAAALLSVNTGHAWDDFLPVAQRFTIATRRRSKT